MYGNSNELQTTSVVPQINIEGNSPEDEGDADYTEGNIDNIGNSKQGNTNNDKGNAQAIQITTKAMAQAIQTTMRTAHLQTMKNMAIHATWIMTKSPSRTDQHRIHK